MPSEISQAFLIFKTQSQSQHFFFKSLLRFLHCPVSGSALKGCRVTRPVLCHSSTTFSSLLLFYLYVLDPVTVSAFLVPSPLSLHSDPLMPPVEQWTPIHFFSPASGGPHSYNCILFHNNIERGLVRHSCFVLITLNYEHKKRSYV